MIGGLFGTLPIFIGGVLNSLLIAAVLAWRLGTPIFWFIEEYRGMQTGS
ncbi:hypothetical protein L499_A3367 [Bordetella holmesii CDC-H635-BH]|uniref:Uncharacterized protein n=1 Tax=Bordetella holmesii CDC-H585-BH TaxID=1331206 RepID=A0A158M6J8_9BORD|nr:hypothetical protein L503_3354 [Bordetella holmesii CDC-H809-BH]KAK89271.1 hypothetical protein L499_A3367 [Bordetella holmesii CDC-H635-BH]KAK96219.1 hypothetical protein L497_3345 [Bordetella holmesii CDC-H585-BH]KCV04956.1 hypothetical protein L498_2950 [Bordetella holmesii CDC-H629-BH]KCV05660.1 hypothetical protein L501_3406 [Bordetella holmesii CDC-H719-BH]KCV14098.1 hypothetical protein AZ25_3069 [Bordetella holmesii 04P3421]KCV14931.1 hypothetical protein L500_3085 [Bordetella holm